MSGQLEALMFGRLLEVTNSSLVESVLVCLIGFIIILVSWKEQIFTAFDRNGATAAGIPSFTVDLLVNAAIAAVVVSASTAVGVLLVVGYLVVPGATARLLARRTSTMVPIAIGVGMIGGYIGLRVMMIDSTHPISPQASVAMSVIALFFLALAWRTSVDKIKNLRKNTPRLETEPEFPHRTGPAGSVAPVFSSAAGGTA